MIEDDLEDCGYTPAQITELTAIIEAEAARRAIPFAADFLHRVFIRVDRDSVHGRALARALGFVDDQSLERAAGQFLVSKQYLGRIELEVEAKLGDCHARRQAPDAADDENQKNAGPS